MTPILTDLRWSITDGVSSSRGFCHESEIDHINILELKLTYTLSIRTSDSHAFVWQQNSHKLH